MVRARLAIWIVLGLTAGGCAFLPGRRSAPPQPPSPTPSSEPPKPVATETRKPTVRFEPVERTTTPGVISRVAADTLAARTAVRRCAGRKLLPDQESTYEATLQLLKQTREAIRKNDLATASSLARRARQLSNSLGC